MQEEKHVIGACIISRKFSGTQVKLQFTHTQTYMYTYDRDTYYY
jgi:hypothetical protein